MALAELGIPEEALSLAISYLSAGQSPADVIAQLGASFAQLTTVILNTIIDLATQAINTALSILPGSSTTAADIETGENEVTVQVEVVIPEVGQPASVQVIKVKLPKDNPQPIWEEIVSDFWAWFRQEYKSGKIPKGGNIPEFEIIGVY